MSTTTSTISSIKSQFKIDLSLPSPSQSYSDLINYGSIRKQFARLIPQYMNYQNKKCFSNLKFSSDLEEYQKLKQEISSMKESISLLKEKKQKKLEQIEQLRCLMRKVGNKQYYHNNNINNNNTNKVNNLHAINRETNIHNNNNQRFRCDKKQICDNNCNTKGSFDESDGALCLVPTTSGISSGKDDEAAPEGGNYQDSGDKQDDDFNNNSSNNCLLHSSSNNKEEYRWNLVVEEDKNSFILGKEV